MKRFIEEADRTQLTLLPESLDDYIGESNPVRAIEAFVAHLDLAELGFRSCPRRRAGPAIIPRFCSGSTSAAISIASPRAAANPQAMRQRRETVEHPFGTIKARMGATHFQMRPLPKVATEMALSVLAYNLTRVINTVGVKPLIAAIQA